LVEDTAQAKNIKREITVIKEKTKSVSSLSGFKIYSLGLIINFNEKHPQSCDKKTTLFLT